jgi:hypothetical protein
MDPYRQYNEQEKYNAYVQSQSENYIDITHYHNDSVRIFAERLFNKSKKILNNDLYRILVDNHMSAVEMFSMLVEIVLYGMDILTSGNYGWLNVTDSTSDIIYDIKKYVETIGFDIIVHEIILPEHEIPLYRDRTDYYCQILPKPPPFLCRGTWNILMYRIIENTHFKYIDNVTPIDDFSALIITHSKQVFTIKFSIR